MRSFHSIIYKISFAEFRYSHFNKFIFRPSRMRWISISEITVTSVVVQSDRLPSIRI